MKKNNFIGLLITIGGLMVSLETLNAQNNDSAQVEQLIKMPLEDLLNIKIISATQTSQTINEAPAIISVITAQEISLRGYRSVGEALQSVAGLDVMYDYVQDNVGIRGVSGGMRGWSQILKVMINKQPVNFRPNSENFLGEELIPINAIERIEIIRGPGSALYGANAFLGVINIITKEPGKSISGNANIGFNNGINHNGIEGDLLISGKNDNINFLIANQISKDDRSGMIPVNVPGRNLYGSEKSKNDISQPYSLYAQFQYKNNNLGKFGFDGSYQHLDSYGEFQDWGVLTHQNRINLLNYFTRATYFNTFAKKIETNFSVAFANGYPGQNDKLNIDTSRATWITRKMGCKSTDLTFNTRILFTANSSFTFGVDHTRDNQNLLTYYSQSVYAGKIPQQGIVYGDTAFINTGIYLQSIIFPAELFNLKKIQNLAITAGVRFDNQNIYGNSLDYRLAGIYNVNPKTVVKLLYGTSYKAPSAEQLYSNYVSTGGVIGNPNLKPETAATYEIALGLKMQEHLNLTTTFFYSQIKNKVELILPYGTISNVSYDNIASINSAGCEAELLHSFHNIISYINVSYQRSIIEKENLIKYKVRLKNELFPDLMVKFGTNIPAPRIKLNFNIEGRYIGSRIASQPNSYIFDPIGFRTNRYSLNPYFLADIAISTMNLRFIKNSETKIQLKIYNIFDKRYAEPGFKDFDIPGLNRYARLSLTQYF